MAVNYNDKRFQQVNKEKETALKEVDSTYNNMINQTDKLYQDQIDASKDWEKTQSELQQQNTDKEEPMQTIQKQVMFTEPMQRLWQVED